MKIKKMQGAEMAQTRKRTRIIHGMESGMKTEKTSDG